MSGTADRAADSVERQIERALRPGRFIADRARFSFVGDLEAVQEQVAKRIDTAPAQAVALYEAFLAGCYEKADEVDDSSGSLGMFVTSLYCGWVQARQAAGAAAEETATRLLEWMDHDPFGFCYQLEREVAKVLDAPGLAALARQVRTRLDSVSAAGPEAGNGESAERDPARRRLAEMLRTLYRQQGDLEAYLGLAQQTGLTAADCHTVAVMLAARGAPEQALSWVERGIELDSTAPHGSFSGHELAALKPGLLKELGCDREALELVWAGYRQHPSKHSYDELMELVSSSERAVWHERAIQAAMGADLHSLIGLLCETGRSSVSPRWWLAAPTMRWRRWGTTHWSRRQRGWRRPTRVRRRGCGVLWACASSTPAKASTTMPPSAALPGPGDAMSGRGVAPTGSRSCAWYAAGIIARPGSCRASRRWWRARGTVSSRRSWSRRRRAGAARPGLPPEHVGSVPWRMRLWEASAPARQAARASGPLPGSVRCQRGCTSSKNPAHFPSTFPPGDVRMRGTGRNRWGRRATARDFGWPFAHVLADNQERIGM